MLGFHLITPLVPVAHILFRHIPARCADDEQRAIVAKSVLSCNGDIGRLEFSAKSDERT